MNFKIKEVPMVSVCMISYGHEKFIEEAINSVLMQECDFEIELILSNDCSPDQTDTIVQNILKSHPKSSSIKYFKHQHNIGMMPNFIFALQQCKGKYIALCEGDDFWTDPLKLQRQVDFLEKNSEYVLSFHNAEVVNCINNSKHLFIDKYNSSDYTLEDIFQTWLIPTASIVYRNQFECNFPLFLTEATHGDLALQAYLSQFGKFSLIGGVMSVYRINDSSVTVNSFSSLTHNNKHIKQLKLTNIYFKNKYETQIEKRIFLYYLRNADLYRKTNVIKPIYWIFRAVLFKPSFIFIYNKPIYNSLKIVFYTMRIFLKNFFNSFFLNQNHKKI